MKKFYLEPEVEIVETELEGFLCGSISEDGEVNPDPVNPGDDDFGDDY